MSDPVISNQGADALDQLVNMAHGEPQESAEQHQPDGWELAGIPGEPVSPQNAESGGEATGSGEGQTDTVPQGVDDPNSYKYFQSRYDTAQEQLRQQQATIDRQQQMLEQLLQQGANGQVNQPGAAVGGQGQESAQPVEVVKPERPANFDAIEAATDPQSESAQYLRDLAEYQEARVEAVEQLVTGQQQMLQREQQRVQHETTMASYRHQLETQYGFTPEQSADFLQVMDDPAVLTFENLVHLYRHMKGLPAAQQEQRRMAAKPSIPVPPLPSSTGGSAPREPAKDPVDGIVDDLIGMSQSSSIFPS